MSGAEPVAGSPGAALAAAREARGLTAAQAAEQLRLTQDAILAMEEGRYQALGSPRPTARRVWTPAGICASTRPC